MKYISLLACLALALSVFAGSCAPVLAQNNTEAGLVLAPPPEPDVPPVITHPTEIDTDFDKIDDRIEAEVEEIKSALATERDPARLAALNAGLEEPIRVELIFSSQITQQHIDDFAGLGGRIDYIYQAVSYGWDATIPLKLAETIAERMGDSLVVIQEDMPAKLTLDEATSTARVRPVWVDGFAGSASGFSGSDSTTIAILDSGIDDSHPDLSGRQEYWMDYTADLESYPRDIVQHGTHVASIALGTGGEAGEHYVSLHYTDSGDMSTLSAGQYFISPIQVEHWNYVAYMLASTASWWGGGSTYLEHLQRPLGSSGGYTISSSTYTTSPAYINTINPNENYQQTVALLQNGSITRYAIRISGQYVGPDDGFDTFRGVAPGCRWAGGKVFRNDGSGSTIDIGEAIDDMVYWRQIHSIKVMNLSLGVEGDPGINTTLRAKVNTAVNNGILVAVAAGNDGPGTQPQNIVDDPGRASLALTVGASNDVRRLTEYTSSGFSSPGADEDLKPDVIAPGGSNYYTYIMSADSDDADAGEASFTDVQANDYANKYGTSMATPFVAGSAALVIQALEQTGVTWNYNSSTCPLLVKMLLCATSTETNAQREMSGTDPTLGRAVSPKDLYEGYGLINVDAAIEAVKLTYSGGVISDSTVGGNYDRRAWGRKMTLTSGSVMRLTLDVPPTGDFDLYLYSGTPDSKGNPVILASSATGGTGVDETLYTPNVTQTAYLVIKRISGTGTWSLNGQCSSPMPTFTPDGGSYNHVVWVNISCPATLIYYTTDGSDPDESDFSIAGGSGSVYVGQSLTLKARGWNSGCALGPIKSASYIIDTTPPTGTNVINGGAAWTTSRTVTLTLSASDNSGTIASMQFSNDIVNWSTPEPYGTSKTWTLSSGDNSSKTVHARFWDPAGNQCTVTDTIGLDTTPPTGSITVNNGDAYTTSQSVTLTLSASDSTSGVYQMQISNNGTFDTEPWEAYATSKPWTLPAGDGSKTVYARFKDNAGKVSSSYQDSIILDTTPPTGSITINNGDAYTISQSVTLTLSASDSTSGVYQMQISNDGTFDTEPWEPYVTSKAWTLLSGDGPKTVWARFKDNAGKVSSSYQDSIILDTTPPTGSITINNGDAYTISQSVTLTLSASDSTSGVYQMQISNDGTFDTEPWEPYVTSKAWTLLSGDGPKTVWARFKDNAGKISNSCQDSITLDTVAPSGTITINGGSPYTTSTSVTLTLSASDATSGVYQMQVSHDGTFDTEPWEPYVTSKPWTLPAGDGSKTVYVRYKDNAGLESTSATDGIWLDATLPVPGAASSAAFTNCSPVGVAYTDASDGGGSNLKRVELWYKAGATGNWTYYGYQAGASGSFDFAPAGAETYYFDLVAEDNAGNRSSVASGSGDCASAYDPSMPLRDIVAQPSGATTVFGPVVVTAVFSSQQRIYVETDNWICGVQVRTNQTFDLGDRVKVTGILQTDAGERYLATANDVELISSDSQLPPLGMRNQWLGGESPSVDVPQVMDGFGFHNTGILVQTWGKVTYIGTDHFYINDGSELWDGSGQIGVRVEISPVPSGLSGKYVRLTAISGAAILGTECVRVLRPRTSDDIEVFADTDFTDTQATTIVGTNMLSLPGIPWSANPETVFVGCSVGITLDGYLKYWNALSQQSVVYSYGHHYYADNLFNCLMGEGYILTIPSGGSTCYHYLSIPVTSDGSTYPKAHQLISLPVGTAGQGDNIFSFVGNPFDANRAWSSMYVTDGSTRAGLCGAGSVQKIQVYAPGVGWTDVDRCVDSMQARKAYKVFPNSNNLALIIPAP